MHDFTNRDLHTTLQSLPFWVPPVCTSLPRRASLPELTQTFPFPSFLRRSTFLLVLVSGTPVLRVRPLLREWTGLPPTTSDLLTLHTKTSDLYYVIYYPYYNSRTRTLPLFCLEILSKTSLFMVRNYLPCLLDPLRSRGPTLYSYYQGGYLYLIYPCLPTVQVTLTQFHLHCPPRDSSAYDRL